MKDLEFNHIFIDEFIENYNLQWSHLTLWLKSSLFYFIYVNDILSILINDMN